MHIYLASKSPRRQSLLRQIEVSFDLIEAEINESPLDDEVPLDYVIRMANEKAKAGWKQKERKFDIPLLAADTSVVLQDTILGKPSNRQDAFNMLSMLSGKTHQVISCVAVLNASQQRLATSITDVTFCDLSKQQIESYIENGNCLDKAGSYGIQGYAAKFVENISGSYSGVVGLPLFETAKLLDVFALKNDNK